MKRTLTKKLAIATGAAALAFGAVACETDGDGLDPAQEDPLLDDGTGTLDDGGMDDGGGVDDTTG